MAITRKQKEVIREGIEQAIVGSKAVVFAGFSGVTVADATLMRRTLKAQGVSYKVTKKKLLEKALASMKVTGEAPKLAGQTAIAYAEDLVAPAREVFAAGKKLDGKVKILGGIFDGVYKDAAAMMAIATIPPTPVLRGMFVNIINSPIQRFVIALDQIAKTKTA